MAQDLFQRALLLAKLEAVFRTDPMSATTPELRKVFTGIDATADVDDAAETITLTGHGLTSGDGPFLVAGTPPTGLSANTEYWLGVVDANTVSVHTSRADAIADASRVDLTDAVGTFSLTARRSDAFLVIDPDFSPDITVIDRTNARPSLSRDPSVVARKIATVTFQHEVRSHGITSEPVPAPELSTLLRGCGYAETRYGGTGAETERIIYDEAVPVNFPTGAFTFTKTGTYAGTLPRVVIIQCTTPGGSGVAQFTVYSPAVGTVQAVVNSTGNTMTDASPFTLAEGATITPTITTAFATGDTFVFLLAPDGSFYEPISDSFESLTLKLHYQSLLHELNGARGTFTCEGEAAGFGTFSFTFTGDYVDPVDVTIPTTIDFTVDGVEGIQPPKIELANLVALGGKDFDATDPDEVNLCAQSFSIDAGNEVIARECINAADSLEGAVIVSRTPVGAFNPEQEQEASHPFWGLLSSGDRVVWALRVGSVQGNVMQVFAPRAQYSEIAYGNRNEIRIYDVNLRFATPTGAGNDELTFLFC